MVHSPLVILRKVAESMSQVSLFPIEHPHKTMDSATDAQNDRIESTP
jgi:hypothetical protein